MTWSEDNLHRWLAKRPMPARSELSGSRGHDAAVLRPHRRARGSDRVRDVLCTDQTIEGVHFAAGASPKAVGRKAAARVLSDLAATAARPRALLLAVRAPKTCTEAWLRSVIDSVARTAAELGAELVGGDLACAPGPAALSVTGLGELRGTRRAPGRDRARPGHVLLLTGPVGGSSRGRHLAFVPRLEEGRWLYEHGATALMDVSDGLALDASRLARASSVRIDLELVPIHRDAHRTARSSGRTPREHALFDGEDHELLATMPRGDWRRVRADASRRWPALTAIGTVRAGHGLWFASESGGALERWNGEGGWVHGS